MATAAFLSAALPYVWWWRSWCRDDVWAGGERLRTLDAYRTPQHHAIADIITATHALMIRELEARTALTERVEQIRQQEHFDMPAEQLMATSVAMGSAVLEVEGALQIGSLTIVDAVLRSDGDRLRRAYPPARRDDRCARNAKP